MNKTYLTEAETKRVYEELCAIADRLGDEVPYAFIVQHDVPDQFITMGRVDGSIPREFTAPEICVLQRMSESENFRSLMALLEAASEEMIASIVSAIRDGGAPTNKMALN